MVKLVLSVVIFIGSFVATAQDVDHSRFIPSPMYYPAVQKQIVYKWPHTYYVPKYVGLVIGWEGVRSNFYQAGLAFNFSEMLELPGGMIGGNLLYKRHFTEGIHSFSLETGVYQIVCAGLNFNYNLQGDHSTFGVKPFLGFTAYHIQLLCGYNLYSKKKNQISALRPLTIELRYVIPLISFGKDKDQMVEDYKLYPGRNNRRDDLYYY